MREIIFVAGLSLLFLIALGYIDFYLLTPLLPLPNDICYFHTHEAPLWIKLFYLDFMQHTEPPYSGIHISILVLSSIGLGYITLNRLKNNKILPIEKILLKK